MQNNYNIKYVPNEIYKKVRPFNNKMNKNSKMMD